MLKVPNELSTNTKDSNGLEHTVYVMHILAANTFSTDGQSVAKK